MSIAKEIEQYKGGRTLPNVEQFTKEYDVEKHNIFTDKIRYPDKRVESEYTDKNGATKKEIKTIPLNRIGLPYQKKIVSIATTFLCGTPIKYTNNLEETDLYDAFLKVIEKNKMKFVDKEIASSLGRYTECAELWYHTKEDNNFYGFDSNFRLKVKVLTPDKNNLYPIFDEHGDLTSFSREFKIGDKTIFEVYTAEKIIRYENTTEWQKVEERENPIGKIPVVFYQQEQVEWADVQTAIERLEQIYSYSAESNDKFAFPILKLRGEVTGQLSKDNTGKVLQLGEQADADFVVPANGNESLSTEIDRLERDVHDFTSTPNISFDNMKGLGNMLAGSSAQFLFLSAHLKVMDKLSVFVPALQRRASIIKTYLQMFHSKFRNADLDIEPVITPFVINNEAEFMRFLMEVNGNKPIYSQEYSMQRAGIKNPETMLQQIQNEENRATETNNSRDFA